MDDFENLPLFYIDQLRSYSFQFLNVRKISYVIHLHDR